MTRPAVPLDTDVEVFELQTERLRAMTTIERRRLVDQLCRDVTRLAVAGIRRQHPEATDDDIRRELTRRRYGDGLAEAAYGPSALT